MEENKVLEFKVKPYAPGVFLIFFYVVYTAWEVIAKRYQDLPGLIIVGLLIAAYLYGFKPHKYTIERKNLVLHYFLRKNKVISTIDLETITDPVPSMRKIISNPHGLELYDVEGTRYFLEPKDNAEFTAALLATNKRISSQVQEYNQKQGINVKRKRNRK